MLVVACLLPTLVTFIYFVWAEGTASGTQQGIYAVAKLVQFALPVVWVAWVCGERLLQGPWQWPRWSTPGVKLGLAFGLAIAAATALLYYLLSGTTLLEVALSPIREKIAGMGLASPWRFLALGLFYSLVHSFMEEYYWRWFVFARLRRLLSLGWSIGISSVGFALHHVVVLWAYFAHAPAAALLLAACVAVGGAFWAWLYQRSGSLYGPWLSHLCVDAAIFGVGYHIARPLFVGE